MFDRVLNSPLNLNAHIVVNALKVCLKVLQCEATIAFRFEEQNYFNVLITTLLVFLKSLSFPLPFFPIILYFGQNFVTRHPEMKQF